MTDPLLAARRLLHVTTIPAALRAFMAPMAAAPLAAGWRVDAAAAHADRVDDLAAAYDARWHVPWSRNPAAPANLLAALPQMRRLLRRERYTLVHVMTPVAAFVTRLAVASLPHARRPAVVYAAHGFHFYDGAPAAANAVYRALERATAPWTDALCVLNDEDHAAAVALGLAPPERIVRLHGPGIDLDRFAPEAVAPEAVAAVRAELGLAPDDVLVTQVAEFIPRKRHADLVRALAHAPGVHLALPGDGPLRASIEALARDLGVRERTHLLGFRRDIPVLIRASRAAVLVSEQEGLPTCLIEALALGVPIVGTDIRGTRELVEASGGHPVPVGDVHALAAVLRDLGTAPPAARSVDRERFGREAVLEAYLRAYRIALGVRYGDDTSFP